MSADSLRGHGAFGKVMRSGRRIDGVYSRCFVLLGDTTGPVHVGFAVSSRDLPAVRRNRIRRLMRAAWQREAGFLRESLKPQTPQMVFLFRPKAGGEIVRLKCSDVQADFHQIGLRLRQLVAGTSR